LIVRALAPAKINLGLEILGRRDDGYHEIRTILAAVSLFDRLLVGSGAEPSFSVDRSELAGDDNLVVRAVNLLRERHPDLTPSIAMRKRIPIASGLGGASSDAVATLLACDLCYGLGSSKTALLEDAARIGSDVPFFLTGGLALSSGRGESIMPLSAPPRLDAVIVAPRLTIPSKTATLYGSLRPVDFTDGRRVESQAQSGLRSIDGELLTNAFERPLYDNFPSLQSIPQILRKHGATAVGLSGAGPAHYALESDPEKARWMASLIREELDGAANVHKVRLISRGIMISISDLDA
jgi:4-diphosphocytidyl-2-C-methyl-D-erythritol kinase